MNRQRAEFLLDQILSEYPKDMGKEKREELVRRALAHLTNAHATRPDFRMTQDEIFVESYLDHQVTRLIGA